MEYIELFGSKDLAEMFVLGFQAAVDMIDDDHAFCNSPEELSTEEWSVTYGIAF